MPLILASTSPIRRQMLDAAGVAYESVRPAVDEDRAKAELNNGAEIAAQLAAAKAMSVGGNGWVIGSDSVVQVGEQLFSKPCNRDEAAQHLRYFSGKTMVLTSAVALVKGGKLDWSCTQTASLAVRPLSDTFITAYLDAEWPEVGYTVGVFRMEARGVQLFSSIEGDHFTILGMPLLPLLNALRERGLILA
ncbi:MAG TPA: Maf family protein [Sphingomicrobium sp.]|nr:Maf family protein [Sphingomicrobium sp.]